MTDNILCDQLFLVIGKSQKKVLHWFHQVYIFAFICISMYIPDIYTDYIFRDIIFAVALVRLICTNDVLP